MVKLGALYLEGGIWQGQQILSKDWVDLAVSREYEFSPVKDSSFVGKGGMYGQMLAFSREQGVAVAYHAHEESDKRKLLMQYLSQISFK